MSSPTIIIAVEVPSVGVAAVTQTAAITPMGAAPVILVPVPGGQGPPGPPGTGTFINGETPAGTINGSNPTFTTSLPFVPGTTAVFLNGLLEYAYGTSPPNSIVFDTAPLGGDTIIINYQVESS